MVLREYRHTPVSRDSPSERTVSLRVDWVFGGLTREGALSH